MRYFKLTFMNDRKLEIAVPDDLFPHTNVRFMEVSSSKRNNEKYYINLNNILYYEEISEENVTQEDRSERS